MPKKNQRKENKMEQNVSRSYSIIKNDLIKLRKDIKDAYSAAKEEAKKQIEFKLNQNKKN
jgi:hypothetical protein